MSLDVLCGAVELLAAEKWERKERERILAS